MKMRTSRQPRSANDPLIAWPRRPDQRGGLTLIELLTVVVLLGMVAALGVPALVRSVEVDPLSEAARNIQQTEAQARALSYGSPLLLEVSSTGLTGVSVSRLTGGQGAAKQARSQPVVQWTAPSTLALQWLSNGKSIDHLGYDSEGRSADCVLEMTQGTRVRRYALAGLTGEWQLMDVTP